MRSALACIILLSACLPARAAVADYCAAFARDEADVRGSAAEPAWQLNFNNAQASCMLRFAPTPQAKAQQAKAIKRPEKPKPLAPAPKASEAAAISPLQEPKSVPALLQGSPEWLAYCKKKYVSFNTTKGTYTSKTGVERKCLVTAE